MLLRVPAGLRREHLVAALQTLLDHHDALRLRLLVPEAGGDRELEVAPPGTIAGAGCLQRLAVDGLDETALRGCLDEARRAAERRLDPAAGVMVQAVWLDAGAAQAGRLLLVIHHLAVDGVSWRILLPDLAACWEAIARGDMPALAPRGTSFRRWAQRLEENAQAPVRVEEAEFWAGMLREPALSLIEGDLVADRDMRGGADQLRLDTSGCCHFTAFEQCPCCLPWRHQRCPAEWAGFGHWAVAP